jgi:hypothetical protein
MGWELSRQLREPCGGLSMVIWRVVRKEGGLRHEACIEAAGYRTGQL